MVCLSVSDAQSDKFRKSCVVLRVKQIQDQGISLLDQTGNATPFTGLHKTILRLMVVITDNPVD